MIPIHQNRSEISEDAIKKFQDSKINLMEDLDIESVQLTTQIMTTEITVIIVMIHTETAMILTTEIETVTTETPTTEIEMDILTIEIETEMKILTIEIEMEMKTLIIVAITVELVIEEIEAVIETDNLKSKKVTKS